MFLITGVLFPGLIGQVKYLDPGSGSFLIQLLIAGLAGLAIFIGASWSKLKRLFRKGKNDAPKIEETEDEDDD
jgi:hypothetical protein